MKKQIRNKRVSAVVGLLLLTGLLQGSAAVMAQTTNTFPADGNVGLGTTAPLYKLHLKGNAKVEDQLVFASPGGNNAGHITTSGEPDLENGLVLVSTRGAGYISFQTNVGEGVYQDKMRLLQNGNVGIGITRPSYKLAVSGEIASANPDNGAAVVRLGWKNSVARIRVGGNGDGSGNGLDIQRYSDESLMRILGNGNVGIGTTTPNAKLAMNGNIRAKEVKVETANWPDYVFGEDYQSPDLKELSAYIKENKRLPGMPSAKEAEADGIDLGEMNRKLLKKVEELTLLLIEKDKQHAGLASMFREQSATLNELRYTINQIIKKD